MRRVIELVASGAIGFAFTYKTCQPKPDPAPSLERTVAGDATLAPAPAPMRVTHDNRDLPPPATQPSPQAEHELNVLRNEVIAAAGHYMSPGGLKSCVDEGLVGPQKLRFALDVDSSSEGVVLGTWRFVEVADGEPVPASFAECAAHVLGASVHRVIHTLERLPVYHGELSFIFTVQ